LVERTTYRRRLSPVVPPAGYLRALCVGRSGEGDGLIKLCHQSFLGIDKGVNTPLSLCGSRRIPQSLALIKSYKVGLRRKRPPGSALKKKSFKASP